MWAGSIPLWLTLGVNRQLALTPRGALPMVRRPSRSRGQELVRRSWHRSCVGVEAPQLGLRVSLSLPPHLLDATPLKPISQLDGLIHLGTPHDDYRSGRTRGDSPGFEGQQQ